MKKEKEINFKGRDYARFILILFIIGSIIGYTYEVIWYLIEDGKLINPGFMYGPFLPIYGFGAILLTLVLDHKKIKKYPFLVFVLGFVVTGILEYFGGYFLYQIYHLRWWDYTGMFLNINGFICLRSLTVFACAGVVLVYFLLPRIKLILSKANKLYVDIIIIISAILMLSDSLISAFTRYKIK